VTLIRAIPLQNAFGDTASPLRNGTVSVVPWAGVRPYVRVDGADVEFPVELTIRIRDGVLDQELEITPPPSGEACVRIRIEDTDRRRTLERFVLVPASGEVDFEDLVDVDPSSFEPVDVTPSLIETIDQRVQDNIGPALDEYMAEHPLEGATTEYVDDTVTAHAESATPHPVYDDMPSLTLIFDNGLV